MDNSLWAVACLDIHSGLHASLQVLTTAVETELIVGLE